MIVNIQSIFDGLLIDLWWNVGEFWYELQRYESFIENYELHNLSCWASQTSFRSINPRVWACQSFPGRA